MTPNSLCAVQKRIRKQRNYFGTYTWQEVVQQNSCSQYEGDFTWSLVVVVRNGS